MGELDTEKTLLLNHGRKMSLMDTEKLKYVATSVIPTQQGTFDKGITFKQQNVVSQACCSCTKLPNRFCNALKNFFSHPEDVKCEHIPQKYGYIFRKKSRWELTLISTAVCGIEFCYAAETAFVTPVLLSLGLNIKFVTMIWCLSPMLAFILTPILGPLSDSCKSSFGRRRPFILTLAFGILIGLFLVPYGRHIGQFLGDATLGSKSYVGNNVALNNLTRTAEYNSSEYDLETLVHLNASTTNDEDILRIPFLHKPNDDNLPVKDKNLTEASTAVPINNVQTWSVVVTVIGTILIDLCADTCQSPCRAYLLDVALPSEQAAGLSTFSLMAGLGASLGYVIGAIKWDISIWGDMLEGQVIVVFSIITVVFVVCLISALSNFPEIPLNVLRDPIMSKEYKEKLHVRSELCSVGKEENQFVSIVESSFSDSTKGNSVEHPKPEIGKRNSIGGLSRSSMKIELETVADNAEHMTLKEYLKSIVNMPKSLWILCLTNFFCWMSIICYCLYFTDFVGESVYHGDPKAPDDSEAYERYKDGVRFGCWGLALSSLFCSFYSLFIEDLVKRFGARSIYISGGVFFAVGMIVMALSRHPVAVIVLSATPGAMYATVFTMPYLLIAHYHAQNKFSNNDDEKIATRGIGTDVAAVTSMLVLSQLVLSLSMGTVVEAVGSNVVIVYAAAIFSACAAVSASQVMYLDL